MVTGNLPAFGTQWHPPYFTVSALGDSIICRAEKKKTPCSHPPALRDGNVYAVAQGSFSVCGFCFQGAAQHRPRRADRRPLANVAIIEREIEFGLNRLPNGALSAHADLHPQSALRAAVNDFLGAKTAEPIDPSTVQLSIPQESRATSSPFYRDRTIAIEPPRR